MIRAVQSPADRAAFARCIDPWPAQRAVMGRDLTLWAGNPGAPVKLFCLSDAGGAVTAALDLYGRTALLAGAVGEEEKEELAAFLRFAGVEKLRTPATLPGWPEREALYGYEWTGQEVPPLPGGCTPEAEPSIAELAALLFPEDAALRDAWYVTACAARNHGLARQWLLRGPGGAPLSTVSAGALYGGEAYLDGGDRLEVENGGGVTYRAAQGGRYPAGPGAAGAIEAARALAEKTVGALCGEASLYLISARQEEDGFEVTFGYRLDGSAVRLYREGWCARFLIREGYITDFTLRLRSYAATEQTAMLLPVDRAAAILPELTGQRLELRILYLDGGADTAAPQWVAE